MIIGDERATFYLRHHREIEEWAALRDEAARAVDDWLAQLGERLHAKLGDPERPVELRSVVSPDERYPKFHLVDPSWDPTNATDPPASVCLEWIRGRTTLAGQLTPYVGLRSPRTLPIGIQLRTLPRMQPRPGQQAVSTSAWWVAYWHVSPAGAFVDDPHAYAEKLAECFWDAWLACAPAIDEARGVLTTAR